MDSGLAPCWSPFEFIRAEIRVICAVVGKGRKSGPKYGAFSIVRSSGAATSPVGMRGEGNTPAGDSLDYHSCKVRSG